MEWKFTGNDLFLVSSEKKKDEFSSGLSWIVIMKFVCVASV